jgi:hypothetical protein
VERGAARSYSILRRYPHNMRYLCYCPCLKLATDQIWEGGLHLCRFHALEWLRSSEKARCVDAEGYWLPGPASLAVQDFADRVWREMPLRVRAWRRLAMHLRG